ncbi:unnamed protein product, partial [Prunus brigantina]
MSNGRMIYGVSEVITGMLLRGRLLVLVLDLLKVVLSLVFIGRVLESHSRLTKDLPEGLKNICMVESEWGKWVVQSAFGIVKHGGVTPHKSWQISATA